MSGDGVKPDPGKVKANEKEVRRLMGIENYLIQFSKRLFEVCALISAIIGQRSEWYWEVEQHKAFDNVKVEISSSPGVCAFYVSCKHRVSVDSREFALDAATRWCCHQLSTRPGS